ncbi:uncharacterized protein [Amphiura filiformis]|uniref:uncharacterized protein n=1 Tax=Amphiura filiformis TaxID=82378 RepID=UPI003B222D6F
MTANPYNTRVKVPNKTSIPGTDADSMKSNDDFSSKPYGRDKSDKSVCNRKNLMNCKKIINISTMNVRTIRENRCREELVSNLIEYNIDILGIQEHRIVHKEPVKFEDILGQTLITTSATRNRAGAATGGVGIVLSANANASLAGVVPHTERILVANFQGNPATTVIVTYCPTNVEDEDKVEDHYDNLRRTIDSIPAHNVLMVIGDFNGRLGPEDAKFTYHDITNRNGKFLVDLAIEKNLICANTYFRKRKGKLWTFCSPAGNKYQLDYILLRKKWRNSLLNAEAYNTFSSVGSDHRIVTSRIRLSLRKNKTLPRGKNHDWKTLCSDSKLQELYTVEVHNRFQPLEEMEETATERYERFIKANRKQQKRVVRARDDIRETYDAYQLDATERNRHRYKEAKANLEEAYNTATEEDLSKRLRAVEEAHDNCKHGQSWKLINEITGRKASVKGQLKGDTQNERINNWFTHFKDLLGSPPEIDGEDEDIVPVAKDLNINVAPFSQEELQRQRLHW